MRQTFVNPYFSPGNVCMQEFKASGSGRQFKTYILKTDLSMVVPSVSAASRVAVLPSRCHARCITFPISVSPLEPTRRFGNRAFRFVGRFSNHFVVCVYVCMYVYIYIHIYIYTYIHTHIHKNTT